jgi:hypothetical protein
MGRDVFAKERYAKVVDPSVEHYSTSSFTALNTAAVFLPKRSLESAQLPWPMSHREYSLWGLTRRAKDLRSSSAGSATNSFRRKECKAPGGWTQSKT